MSLRYHGILWCCCWYVVNDNLRSSQIYTNQLQHFNNLVVLMLWSLHWNDLMLAMVNRCRTDCFSYYMSNYLFVCVGINCSHFRSL